MKVYLKSIIVTLLLFSFSSPNVYAAPYNSYIYEKQTGRALYAPAGAVPDKIINGNTFQINALKDPADAFSDSQGNIFILDSGNGRILCIDSSLERLKFTIQSAQEETEANVSFKGAQGIFVNLEYIYVADSENSRILRYKMPENQGVLTALKPDIINPTGLLFDTKKTPFKPLKLVVDDMERIFIVCNGIYEGLVELSEDGRFLAYVGANKVVVDLMEQFWRLFATEAQWNAYKKFVPVEFGNVCIDNENFIFATARGKTGNSGLIRRLNLSGTDILHSDDDKSNLGDLFGYTVNANRTKESHFVDAAAGPFGTFMGLDITKGRVFVYDSKCTLLYEFGGLGTQIGTFISPSALIVLPDNKFGVLDRRNGDLTIFRSTDYGNLLLSSAEYEFNGEYENAAQAYIQILSMNSNAELPYIGVGKQLFKQGNYEEAMKYFKLGNSRKYYSKAYEEQRKKTLGIVIPGFLIAIITLVIVLCAIGIYKRIKWMRLSIKNIMRMYTIK